MKAERLHCVILALQQDLRKGKKIDRLNDLVKSLQGFVDRRDESTEQHLADARQHFLNTFRESPTDSLDCHSRAILKEVGEADLFGGGLRQRVQQVLDDNAIVPAVALTELQTLVQRVNAFNDALDKAAKIFQSFKIGIKKAGRSQTQVRDIDLGRTSAAESFLASTIKLIPLYGAYLFLSGWASLDYYYRFFGMDPKSLDIGFYDIALRGFTILFPVPRFSTSWLFHGPGRLWFIYGIVIVLTILSEHFSWLARHLVARALAIGILVLLLLGVYYVSRNAGEDRARLDKGNQTTLPAILFEVRDSTSQTVFHGKLLLLRNGLYFVHGVAPIGKTPLGKLQVSVYRAEELKDVSVVEHQ
jgi:hypothetical protein